MESTISASVKIIATVGGCFYLGSRNLKNCRSKPHWEVFEDGTSVPTLCCTSHVGAALVHGKNYTVRAYAKAKTGD
jgi:hypothetical protein